MSSDLSLYCRYAENGASSRLRFFRYLPALNEAGIRAQCLPFFDAAYLERFYAGCGKSRTAWLRSLWKRFQQIRNDRAKAFLVEYELFPFLPAAFELAAFRRRPCILNFDDPVWEKYSKIPFLKDKYDTLIRHASGVIAANHLLFDRCRALNPHTLLLPTVIDLDRYRIFEEKEKFPVFTVVWIGNPATYHYLQSASEILRALAAEFQFELLIIGKSSLPPVPGVPCRCVDWSEETECELLGRSHLGIMPLADDGFSRGKSSYKLIQYMGAGIPALASSVGENSHVLRDGTTGFFCDTPGQWIEHFSRLYRNCEERLQLGENARKEAEHYTLSFHFPRFLQFIRENTGLE